MTPDGEGLPDSLSLAELFPVIQQRSGIYSVSFDELKLPPRQIPTKFGEFVRVVDDPDYRRIDCYFLAEQGSKACLAIPNADLHEVPRFAKVPMKNVMKIFPRYHSHENHSHQSLLMEAAELLQKGVFLLEAGDSASLSH